MMLSSGALVAAKAAGVGPRDFYKPEHADVYRAMLDADAEGFNVDPVSVAARLNGNRDWPRLLRQLHAGTPASSNAPAYARIVRDCSRRRRLASDLQCASQALTAGADI